MLKVVKKCLFLTKIVIHIFSREKTNPEKCSKHNLLILLSVQIIICTIKYLSLLPESTSTILLITLFV